MEEREHGLSLENRAVLELQGALKVESSDESTILLKTVMGDLVISGDGLHIRHLDLEAGEVTIGGRIDALQYPAAPLRHKAKAKSGGIMRRLLK